MKISLIELRGKVRTFEETSDAEKLALDKEIFQDPVDLKISAQEMPTGYRIDLAISTEVHRICDRCTCDNVLALGLQKQVYACWADLDANLSEDDSMLIIHAEDEHLDLEQEIRDHLVLALDDRYFCARDCRGLCSGCGCNLNFEDCQCAEKGIDSPFAALNKLKK
jgi:uncharacterized protein